MTLNFYNLYSWLSALALAPHALCVQSIWSCTKTPNMRYQLWLVAESLWTRSWITCWTFSMVGLPMNGDTWSNKPGVTLQLYLSCVDIYGLFCLYDLIFWWEYFRLVDEYNAYERNFFKQTFFSVILLLSDFRNKFY